MTTWLPLFALIGSVGVALLLARFEAFRTGSLADRLAPHVGHTDRAGVAPRRSIADLARELSVDWAAKLGDVVGAAHATEQHLARTADGDIGTFRSRQLAAAVAALVAATGLVALAGVPAALALIAVLLAPALAVAIIEQRLAERSAAIQRRASLELPVVCEQLGMLLAAGFSLTSALNRIAARSNGILASGFRQVISDTHHGEPVTRAIRRWADVLDVAGVHRLAGLLDLNHEAADLGSLVTAEARLARAELHRRQLETIERRAQQVWIPVTVATLVPGVMFIAVPFVAAMAQLTG